MFVYLDILKDICIKEIHEFLLLSIIYIIKVNIQSSKLNLKNFICILINNREKNF